MLTMEVIGAWILMCIAFYGLRRRRTREARAAQVTAETYGDHVESARDNEQHYSA
jgi:hypothetical protein